MSTSTSPAAGTGSARFPYSRTSGGPNLRKKEAFMVRVLRSIGSDAARLDELRIALHLRRQEFAGFLRRRAEGLEALRLEAVADLGGSERAVQRPVQAR